jgi:hypothetical protein
VIIHLECLLVPIILSFKLSIFISIQLFSYHEFSFVSKHVEEQFLNKLEFKTLIYLNKVKARHIYLININLNFYDYIFSKSKTK